MPLPKKYRKAPEIVDQLSELLGISKERIFLTQEYKTVIHVWTVDLSEKKVAELYSFKEQVKELVAPLGAKVSLSATHPHEKVKKVQTNRKGRHKAWKNRKALRNRKES